MTEFSIPTRITKLFNNPLLSDITLSASCGTTFPAHRNILIGLTDFFESAVSKESGFLESSNNVVELPEHGSVAVRAFLEYGYTSKYTFLGDKNGNPPTLDFEVYQLADYVLAAEVKVYAAKMIRERLDRLLEMTVKEIEVNGALLPDLVRAVYSGSSADEDNETKEVVVGAVAIGVAKMGHAFMVPLLEVMKDFGEFSTAVFEKLVKKEMIQHHASASFMGWCRHCGLHKSYILTFDDPYRVRPFQCLGCNHGGFKGAEIGNLKYS